MNFDLTILGSSSGAPTPDRYQTAQHLLFHNHHFLIDCGEAAQMQLMKYNLGYMKIEAVFISHLHADHYIGLIGLLNTMSLNCRENDLLIFCPEGLDEIIDVQLKHSHVELNFKIIYHFTSQGKFEKIYDSVFLEVFSFPLVHRIPVTGFLFKEKSFLRKIRKDLPDLDSIPLKAFNILKNGEDFLDELNGKLYKCAEYTIPPPPPRSFAFITDTVYYPEIAKYVTGVDLLYHEATFTDELMDKSVDRFHSTNSEAARFAKEINAGRLVIGHFSTRFKDLQPLLEEARVIFPETYLAVEGGKFNITGRAK